MKIVGLTGGIACGKSTVARMLRDLGVPVVDADRLAAEILDPGEEAFNDVVAVFGKGILTQEGEIDRERLGQAVFGDETLRRRLEQITHPRIAIRARKAFEIIESRGVEVAVYEAALLIETGMYKMLAANIVVSVPPVVQIERLMTRDGLSEEGARARLRAQIPIHEKMALADYVIDNSGDTEATRNQVVEIWGKITSRFMVKN